MQGTNLNDILIFLAVVDAGSFAAGGQAAGMSRSAAGKAVTRLETRLGTRLLNRTTRSLSLTHEGSTFYGQGLRIIESIRQAEQSVAGAGRAPRGVLRLTLPDAFGRRVVMPLLARFLEAWPDMQVEVSFTDRVDDIVDDGFDLALRIGVTNSDTSLVSRVIARYQTVLCASPAYLAAHGEPRSIDDLAEHECLYFTSRGQRQAWMITDEEGGAARSAGRSRLRLDSGEAIRGAAVSGLGIAYLPSFLVQDDLAAGNLRPVLDGLVKAEVPVLALYPSKRLLEPRVRQFIDLVAGTLS